MLSYGISWTGALLVALPTLLKHQPFEKMAGLIMFPVMLLGPPAAGLILTYLQSGKSGIRALGQRMRRWKIQKENYMVAFILPPVLILLTLSLFRYIISPAFAPNFFPPGVLFGIFAGFLEEIGWTGYAYPSLRKKFSAPVAAMILGLFWGIWHLPVIDFLGAAFPHGSSLPLFMVAFCSAITTVRLLICWIYEHTESVLYAQIMHAVSTGSLVMFGPAMVTPGERGNLVRLLCDPSFAHYWNRILYFPEKTKLNITQ